MAEWSSGIAWASYLETGNAAIDEQHKQLFKLTSDLAEATSNASSAIEETLAFLVAYTVKHFADEEALQVKYNYPDYENHKKLHDEFKATVGVLQGEFKAAAIDEERAKALSDKVKSIIVRWLIKHIQREDSKIAAHIKSNQVSHG